MTRQELFGTKLIQKRPAITKHLGNIFKEGELDGHVVGSILERTTEHGAISVRRMGTMRWSRRIDNPTHALEESCGFGAAQVPVRKKLWGRCNLWPDGCVK